MDKMYIIVLCMTIIISCIFNNNKKYELFINSIKIVLVSKQELRYIINTLEYFESMSALDLVARHVETKEEYKQLYLNSYEEFTDEELSILSAVIKDIDYMTLGTKKYKVIPWKFVKVNSNIENGYPHTLKDVIVLNSRVLESSNKDLINTLTHEKIHIYQRKYQDETSTLLSILSYKEISSGIIPEIILRRKRNNPDIKNYYMKDNIINLQLYLSDQPRNISSSSSYSYNTKTKQLQKASRNYNTSQTEHPYEIMASIIPKILYNSNYSKNAETDIIKQWCSIYL